MFEPQASLFESAPTGAPLAHRLRPKTLEEFVGHEKFLGPKGALRRWIEADQIPSMILWGPPGCGKTTLAEMISHLTKSRFQKLSAVSSGVKDIKEVGERVMGRTLLFVDEIHRFNRSQQDTLLPYVETGKLILIGATTENPSFELNAALLSRLKVIRLEMLREQDIVAVLERALSHLEGLRDQMVLEPEVLHWIASFSDGDARKALTTLEHLRFSAVRSGIPAQQKISIDEAKVLLEAVLSTRTLVYDKTGEEHHNVVSAFIKSIRDSDPHAGLYYLARMIESGEDPLFIARRLVILASEDVGNADPRGLQIALSAKEAVDFVGMPEGRICLAQAVTYLAMAPKSNAAYLGIDAALECVQETGTLAVPMHLRNAQTQLMKSEGYGKGYTYAHDQVDQRAVQTHLPKEIVGRRFYNPKEVGYEKMHKEKLDVLNPDFEK